MKAWCLAEPNNVALTEMESQPIGDSCVKVKLLYCSVSITDRLLAKGKIKAEYPLILGRQASGMVVETGENVKNFARGDIVAIKPFAVCASCVKCAEGKYNECENMLTYGVSEDGMLRDFAIVNAMDLLKLPERVTPKEAVFLDYIDIAINCINHLNMEKGEFLVIAGATQLGIILSQVAIYYQLVPILIDNNLTFLETATSLGVYYTVNSAEVDTRKKVFALTGGKMADAVAYITESEYPLNQALDLVKKYGSMALCGLEKSRLELNAPLSLVLNRGLHIYGIGESNQNLSAAINMLAGKTVNVAQLYGEEIAFENVGEELMRDITPHSVYLKSLVKME